MNSGGDPPAPFAVSYPGTVREALAELYKRGRRLGIGLQVLSAMRLIDVQLRQHPLEFGDPNYRLKVFEVHVGIVAPLVVHYGVNVPNRVVLVTRVQGLPGTGL